MILFVQNLHFIIAFTLHMVDMDRNEIHKFICLIPDIVNSWIVFPLSGNSKYSTAVPQQYSI